VRDSASWRKDLVEDLRQASFPEKVMPIEAFCAVELGLYFLTRHFSAEPVGALQPLLSGYVADRSLDAVMRRVRHRMGDVARRGYWRRLLNHYMRVPLKWRYFDRTDDPRRRVSDQTVFVTKPSSYCPERTEAYATALSEPLQYVAATQYPPAEAGKRYWFPLRGDRVEHVRLPEALPSTPPIERLPVVTARTRVPWTISFVKDLEPTAKWIDEQIAGRLDITSRNWVKRLEDIRFSVVDPASPTLIDQPEDFVIDGIAHIVGLMNSGKTTLADLITISRVQHYGNRVCLVVSSVGDVFNKVSFLRTLGIDAVPLIGRSSRAEHSARYWRTMVEEAAVLIPDEDTPPDPAAGYANASCLLEPFRRSSGPAWAPLSPNEFPCRGSLREAEADNPRIYDCPLLSICPAQKAYREIATAQVWVTTPQCLVSSRAEPAMASVRWFEAAQGHIDLMIIDEADAVQQVLDGRFVQTERLVSADKTSHAVRCQAGAGHSSR
jgi:hypothetical protein